MTITDFKEFIIKSLNLEGVRADMIGDYDPLFGDGLGLDSVDALELVVAMEKEHGLKIQSHEIEKEAFATVTSLFRFIEGRLGARDSGA